MVRNASPHGITGASDSEAVVEWGSYQWWRLHAGASPELVEILERERMTNERKNITQPSDWWAAFEEAAKAEGLTLAAWLGEAAKKQLPPKVAKKLTDRPPANRPPKAKD
jgi:hypothetical protein